MEHPTVGRIVHYIAYGTPGGEYAAGTHRAAIITEVHTPTNVSLCVFNPAGLHFVPSRPYSPVVDGVPSPAPGTWHWPER